jgi:uncharacterized membrane protein
MAGFIDDYFLNPIWDRTGYNAVNTLIYAAIALGAAWLIYKGLKREKIKIDEKFVLSIIPYILLGSTARVITDAVDTGVMQLSAGAGNPLAQLVLNSHIYDYSYLTVTPGIYVVTGLLTLAAVFGFNRMRRPELLAPVGLVLWLSQLILLAPLLQFWSFAVMALALAVAGGLAGSVVLRFLKMPSLVGSLVIFSHALDGAATFVVINVFGPAVGKPYFEQHVLSRLIGTVGDSMFTFFIVKVAVATLAMVVLEKESENKEEKLFIALLLLIFGLAPGVRDLLRMLCGA